MVYCGKPSKGCSSCRERKIRCDQKEPSCGQCEKRQQQCPGYRNLVDLMFRDESSHVIKKAAKTRARGRARQPTASIAAAEAPEHGFAGPFNTDTESSDPLPQISKGASPRRPTPSRALSVVTQNVSIRNRPRLTPWVSPPDPAYFQDEDSDNENDDGLLPSPDEGNWPASPPATLLYSLSPSYQERGTAYFFSRYVSVDENACYQNYDFIFDIWRPSSMVPGRQVDGVMASMTAVGLAGLSDLTKCTRTMDWARRSYGTALRLTNEALRDPSEAVKDTTMLSILILTTYEMLTGRNPQTVRAWQEHLNGAAALAKMRGLGQFRSKAGVRMFIMLTHIALISCIQRSMPMPQPLVDLRNQLGMLSPPGDPNWRMSGSIYKVLQLRHDIKRGKLKHKDAIIDQLSKVDEEFVDIIADLPESWHYRPVSLSQAHPAVFDGYHCHVYPALTLAATWNGIRSIRMLVHETIIGELFKCCHDQQILSWTYAAKLQLAKSVDTLEKLRDAILASVPQHFGVVGFRDARPESHGLPVAVVKVRRPPLRATPSPTTSALSSPGSPSASPSSPGAFNGPTLHDPTQAADLDNSAERFMTLASASNTIVWPLYLLGVSSSCTHEIKEYVIGRLQAILEETSLMQAGGVAQMVRSKEISIPWSDLPWDEMPNPPALADNMLV
ncbi:C6 finger domain-containing protein [Colletotrichum truncatum]|uniref:C6 finger domain-containing protein n=1 Tax=Colletotrichum truncatum TaxID=5467 RepID=A0ACC3YFZ9_COLTU|nr:C6 finger domain-containing protein [Colletotrichum truncatum]KAF6784544.1 C6 finger domain-containing protein [Colletotrichum truncatum]